VEKAQARREAGERVAAISAEERLAKSRRIAAALLAVPEFAAARVVMLYASMADEVDTRPVIETALSLGKMVVLPKVLSRGEMVACPVACAGELSPGAYGILEPAGKATLDASAIDFCLVPARAFDRSGVRLGRGAGYYDRFMATAGFRAFRCGVAFNEQIVPSLHREPHDLPVQLIVTDSELILPQE